MSIAMWNCHSWPLDVSSNVKLPLAKVGLSAKFGVVVVKASILHSVGGPSAKVGSSAKFHVVVFKASVLDYPRGGSIIQSRFVCQVWCSSIQGIHSGFTRGSISQSRLVCQVWCSSIQGIYSGLPGGPSAKFCVLVFKANITCQSWSLFLSFGGCFRGVKGVTYDMTVQC